MQTATQSGAPAPCRSQVGRHARRVDQVDLHPGGNRDAVGAVGIVEQREPHAVALHPQRVVGRAVEAVGKDAGMQDAAAPQFRDGRTHPGSTAVAAMVVSQHGHVDPGVAQGIGQRHGRAETGVARVAIRAGERRFETVPGTPPHIFRS